MTFSFLSQIPLRYTGHTWAITWDALRLHLSNTPDALGLNKFLRDALGTHRIIELKRKDLLF